MGLNKIELSILSIIMVSKLNVLQLIRCSWPFLRAWKKLEREDHLTTGYWSNKGNASPPVPNFTHTHFLWFYPEKLKKPWSLLWSHTTEVISLGIHIFPCILCHITWSPHVKIANMCRSPLEIYTFLKSSGFCLIYCCTTNRTWYVGPHRTMCWNHQKHKYCSLLLIGILG